MELLLRLEKRNSVMSGRMQGPAEAYDKEVGITRAGSGVPC